LADSLPVHHFRSEYDRGVNTFSPEVCIALQLLHPNREHLIDHMLCFRVDCTRVNIAVSQRNPLIPGAKLTLIASMAYSTAEFVQSSNQRHSRGLKGTDYLFVVRINNRRHRDATWMRSGRGEASPIQSTRIKLNREDTIVRASAVKPDMAHPT
jgi:hypothetical protein